MALIIMMYADFIRIKYVVTFSPEHHKSVHFCGRDMNAFTKEASSTLQVSNISFEICFLG